ncbi:suppressor APC domain-containing protein 2 [Fopius arisanus]|uniref:Suppressor APC domain-containing protein 2 n=1 Tax=Fopius arisanus TaxID=64838 RepID=A0A9R1TT77_9HYME|nr:PREDICTED: suppressor APC domain-containing protein 2 [Fopius arisanus]
MAQLQSSTDDLPKSFLSAMRTLFRIMDDQNSGYVKYSDIEERWQDDGTQGLPRGVLESLKKITPPNGLLSFDRFCAGLKMCLLQIKNESDMKEKPRESVQPNRPPSAPFLTGDGQTKTTWTSPNTAAIRPNNANAISQQRTLSMPQLIPGKKEPPNNSYHYHNHHHHYGANDNPTNSNQIPLESIDARSNQEVKVIKPFGPPKPPRTGAANFDKSEIRTALQNWQMGLMMSDGDKCIDKPRQMVPNASNYAVDSRSLSSLRPQRILGDGKAGEILNNEIGIPLKKNTVRRREPRRHTLQNGIDYNLVKRMKQIEQERDVLLQGLAAVDKAREWYLKQISVTQEKIRHLGNMGSHVEQWTEAQQERLELQRARVLEVNRHLAALITSWERGGLPMHMNLAFLSTPSSTQLSQDMMARLKQQNRRLTEEVSKKGHKIVLLEQEKENLMRELYSRQSGLIQSRRSTMIHEQHDQTFM